MIRLEGCHIAPLDQEGCRAVLEWVAGGVKPAECGDVDWLLAHCRDGVTWGRFERAGQN